jgi:fructokinase
MDTKIVIGVGEFLWDVPPTGKKAGGAPVNFAFHASGDGVEGWAVSAVGRDALGEELVATAKANGIKLLVSEVNYPTGTVDVLLKNGQPDYRINENVAWDYIPLTDEVLKMTAKASAITFGTLAQRSKVSRETTQAMLKAAPKDAWKVYDINLRQKFYSKELIEESLKLANVFKINNDEMEILKPMFGLEDKDYDGAAQWFISNYGLKLLVLTAGEYYSSIYSPEGKVSETPTPKVKVEDSIGAGDSFTGTLIAELLRGRSIAEAHRSAVETAAYVCTKSGAWHKKGCE